MRLALFACAWISLSAVFEPISASFYSLLDFILALVEKNHILEYVDSSDGKE